VLRSTSIHCIELKLRDINTVRRVEPSTAERGTKIWGHFQKRVLVLVNLQIPAASYEVTILSTSSS